MPRTGPIPARSARWCSTCRPRRPRSPACRAISTSTTPATTGCRAASRSNTRSGSGWCCSACSGSGCRSRSAAPRVFFRRSVLEQLGGWDAHNVTEDADLGMRLARFGYRCEMIPSTTWEEANCRVRPWIRQRSRWLKGYAVTWATHMRRPRELWRDLGPARLRRLPGAVSRRDHLLPRAAAVLGGSGSPAAAFGARRSGTACRPGWSGASSPRCSPGRR